MKAIAHGKKSCLVYFNDLFQDLSYSISFCMTYFSQLTKLALLVIQMIILLYKKYLKKANKKVCVSARITPYMSIPKRKQLMNSFFISQFNYCPLVCPHSRLMNNKINRLHEKCLRIVYSDKTLSFEELLDKTDLLPYT